MADEITDVAVKLVTKDIKEELGGTKAKELMKSAIEFLDTLQKIINQQEHIRRALLLGNDSLTHLKEAMKNSQTTLQNVIKAQYTFEEQVNKFLGRQIHFAWMDVDTGELFLVKEADAKQIYQKVSRAKGYTGSILLKPQQVQGFKDELRDLDSFVEKEYQNAVNKRINQHQELIAEVMHRMTQNSDKNNQPWYEKHPRTVYWKYPPEGDKEQIIKNTHWAWSIPTKKGFITQGYVNFIFNSTEDLKGIGEWNIGHFMMEFVQAGDSIPGIVKGDITVNDTNDRVQIAVKSNVLFSTASIGPYIATAYQIIQFYDKIEKLDVNEVKKILDDFTNESGKYKAWILDQSRKNLEEKISSALNKEPGFKVI